MSIVLAVNDLIVWKTENKPHVLERILWLDEDYSLAYVIDVNAKKGFPRPVTVRQIMDSIEMSLAEISDVDPFIRYIPEDQLTEKHRKIRDDRWKLIEPLVTMDNFFTVYLERELRGSLISKAAKSAGKKNEKIVYDSLRKFFQKGMSKNALLPDFNTEQKRGTERTIIKKLGRPRIFASIRGEGINVDESVEKAFWFGINEFYLNLKKHSLAYTFRQIIAMFFAEDFRIENGIRKPILMDPSKRPTLTQFRDWYAVHKDIKDEIIKRYGRKVYDKDHRPSLGNVDMTVRGPGQQFQIDATVANVYLISRFDKDHIIGRPVIYCVMDVFSRKVVGLYVGLEGPSYLGAMMALVNTASDKVEFCKQYDIEIDQNEWACRHLPQSLLADRGEIFGHNVENLREVFKVDIINTPPYRPDWKPALERFFGTFDGQVKPYMPGYVQSDFGSRGSRDYPLDARLNLYQFTRFVIKLVRNYNNSMLQSYKRDQEMISDHVRATPNELWQWGLKRRSGYLISAKEAIVKLTLLPAAKATITIHGIKYKKMLYSCEKALRERWFDNRRGESLVFKYDPRDMNKIYLPSDDGMDYDVCHLLEIGTEFERFVNRSEWEIDQMLAYEKLNLQLEQEGIKMQTDVDLMAELEADLNVYVREAEEEMDMDISKTKKRSEIRNNRAEEKEEIRKEESFDLEEEKPRKNKPSKGSVIPFTKKYEDEDDVLDWLEKKQGEHFDGK